MWMSVEDNETRTLDGAKGVGASAYLLAIDNESSRRIMLPSDGALQIGRAPECEVHVASDAVSRQHAKVVVVAGRAEIVDLGSHNGTLVNGERVVGSCPLQSGDVIAIADTLLIVRSTSASALRPPIDLEQMIRRIDEEIARATDYDRPFTIVVMRRDGSMLDAVTAVSSALRSMDVLCVSGNTIITLMPELDAEAGRSQADALLDAVGHSSARAGVASYPTDGGDTATLLAAARNALAVTHVGQVANVAKAVVEYRVGDHRILVADPAMLRLYELVRRLARSDISVLVTGETGSGKENAAAALHHWSPRAAGPFVSLNCAAMPETLAESELFGYERGAFTEARAPKPGILERANGGTVFLDEVGDLSPALQAKLLRALESKRITRLGDVRERALDVRVVAATNVDLDAAVRDKRFRQDLLFRLSAASVIIPPLRHRRQEIPLLARMFVQLECERLGRMPLDIAEPALALLARYDFPGNVRELKNALDYAVATSDGPAIQLADLPSRMTGRGEPGDVVTAPRRPLAEELRELERQRIIEALDANDGVQTRAAAALGMPLRTFTFRMRQYRIEGRLRSR